MSFCGASILHDGSHEWQAYPKCRPRYNVIAVVTIFVDIIHSHSVPKVALHGYFFKIGDEMKARTTGEKLRSKVLFSMIEL